MYQKIGIPEVYWSEIRNRDNSFEKRYESVCESFFERNVIDKIKKPGRISFDDLQ